MSSISPKQSQASLRGAFDEYYRQLCFFARRYLADENDVKDVVMDAFLAVYDKGLTFPTRLALRAFLYTAVYNASMNRLRHSARCDRNHQRIARESTAGSEEEYVIDRIEDDVIFHLLSAVEQLPSQCARVFKASYFEGRSIGEVAELMGISENTVRAQRARARKLLQARLRDLYPVIATLFAI